MHVQSIVGKLLYFALAIDNTILVTLRELVSEQEKSKETTMWTVTYLLNYMATNPDAKIRFHKIIMVLHIHRNVLYLSAPKDQSRVGGYFYL